MCQHERHALDTGVLYSPLVEVHKTFVVLELWSAIRQVQKRNSPYLAEKDRESSLELHYDEDAKE